MYIRAYITKIENLSFLSFLSNPVPVVANARSLINAPWRGGSPNKR